MHRNQISGPTIRARTNDVFGMDVLSAAQAKSGPLGGRLTVASALARPSAASWGAKNPSALRRPGFLRPCASSRSGGAPYSWAPWKPVLRDKSSSLGVPNPKTPDFLDGSPLTKGQGWGGWALGWAGGGGWKVTVGGAISLTPDFLKPIEQWEFNSVSVQVGGGGGADCGYVPAGLRDGGGRAPAGKVVSAGVRGGFSSTNRAA